MPIILLLFKGRSPSAASCAILYVTRVGRRPNFRGVGTYCNAACEAAVLLEQPETLAFNML